MKKNDLIQLGVKYIFIPSIFLSLCLPILQLSSCKKEMETPPSC